MVYVFVFEWFSDVFLGFGMSPQVFMECEYRASFSSVLVSGGGFYLPKWVTHEYVQG